MSKIRLLGGKPLLIGGKVALSDTCCCGGQQDECPCSLSSDDCPHAICLEFNPATEILDSGTYWDAGYIFGFNGVTEPILSIYVYDSGGGNFLAGAAFQSASSGLVSVEVPMTLDEFFDNWHGLSASINASGTITLCAYGGVDVGFFTTSFRNITDFFIGSSFAFPGPVDIQIRNIRLLANPDSSELDFIFPTTGFDSTIGTGQSTSGGTVRIQCSDGLTNGYLKNLSPPYDFQCENCETLCPPFGQKPNRIIAEGNYRLQGNDYLLSIDGTPSWNIEGADCIGRVEQSTFTASVNCSSPPGVNFVDLRFFVQVLPQIITGTGNNCSVTNWLLQGAVIQSGNELICNAIFDGACATSDSFTPAGLYMTHFYDCAGFNNCPSCPGGLVHNANWNITVQ